MIPRGCGNAREPAGSAALAGGFTPGIERERSAVGNRKLHPGTRYMGLTFLEIYCLFFGTSVPLMADIEAGLSPTAKVARGQRKDLVMGEARLHVVFGTGQVGNALAAGVTQGSVASPAAR
jgi:hypothetical protein